MTNLNAWHTYARRCAPLPLPYRAGATHPKVGQYVLPLHGCCVALLPPLARHPLNGLLLAPHVVLLQGRWPAGRGLGTAGPL